MRSAILKFLRFLTLSTLVLFNSCLIDEEVETNDSFETATPASIILLTPFVRGSFLPISDKVDFYSFTADAGDRVFLASMSSFSSGKSDISLKLYREDRSTLLASTSYKANSKNISAGISGLELPATETYYIKAEGEDVRPYYLYLNMVPSATVIPDETEDNDSYDTAQELPAESIVKGQITNAGTDVYKLELEAGDRAYIALDQKPESDETAFDGVLSFSSNGQDLITSQKDGTENSDSQVIFVTVKETGTYHIKVEDAAGLGGVDSNYILNVKTLSTGSIDQCQKFSSSSALELKDQKLSESLIEITEQDKVGKLMLELDLNHSRLEDLDLVLESPNGSRTALFTDLSSGDTENLNIALADYEGSFPINFYSKTPSKYIMQPENHARLDTFHGVNANGTWKLKIYDDSKGAVGTLNSWSLYLCPNTSTSKEIVCDTGLAKSTVVYNDFEENDGQLKSLESRSQWQYGKIMQAASSDNAAFDKCNSGEKCWKTNLNGSYKKDSSQTLKKTISLVGASYPVVLAWSQKFQLDAADKSSYTVSIQEAEPNASRYTIFQYQQSLMQEKVGKNSLIQEVAGWGEETKDISGYEGKVFDIYFKLTSKSAKKLPGVAIDDLEVVACFPDSDSNGIADRDELCPNQSNPEQMNKCVLVEELRSRLNELRGLADSLVLTNGKFDANAKLISLELKNKSQDFYNFIKASGNEIILSNNTKKIDGLTKRLELAIKKQRRGTNTYRRDKKAVLAGIDNLLGLI